MGSAELPSAQGVLGVRWEDGLLIAPASPPGPPLQDALNVFLGSFRPQAGKPHVWELQSDAYLHTGERFI